MKKIILLGALLALLVGSSYGQNLRYPFGAATAVTSDADSLTLALSPTNALEVVTITAETLDTILTINVTIGAQARIGDMLLIEATADGSNRAITFGTGITGAANTVTATKTDVLTAIYNGTAYIVIARRNEN